MKLEDIESVFVHWSESRLINDVLGCDDNCDIEKSVEPAEFDKLVIQAASKVGKSNDKTVLTVKLKNGIVYCDNSKCYLNVTNNTLIKLIAD
ncbi:MAG: hypothetical protein QM500_19895 [Methylococcales bacterium]